jgi:hypothetical protein
MELPTYTNIWKIEKRLYKLYDFRLPMPLPVGQMAVFVAIAVPYMLILTIAGMPFSHTWVWLYVLPPGVLAWLVTRPVLESKRLPELVLSQLRYLSEPRTWCRMAPLAEKDEITVFARVWRRAAAAPAADALAVGVQTVDVRADDVQEAEAETVSAELIAAGTVAAVAAGAEPVAADDGNDVPARPVWPSSPAIHAPAAGAAPAAVRMPASGPGVVIAPDVSARRVTAPAATARAATASAGIAPAASEPAIAVPATSAPPSRTAPPRPAASPAPAVPPVPTARPGLTVATDGRTAEPLHLVERALRRSPGSGPASGWNDRVVVVPGGHRPGKPDQVQRDQARARLPLAGPARVVVLGCTAGAGQTVTTLLAGHLLSGLRGEAVAVLDLSPGPGSLTEQARQIPRLLPGRRASAGSQERGPNRERGLQVVTAAGDAEEPADAGTLVDAVVARYPLTLADPAAAQVPRALHVADQLVLVAPAGPDAAGALAMTLEWLDGHGHTELARRAVAVLNGVSVNSAAHTDRAAAVAAGWCRAIVRVPWDSGLSGHGPLGVATLHAYTALAGVLVSGLAGVAASPAGQSRSAQSRSVGQ